MKILLTGANGMVGSWLVSQWAGSQHVILATGKDACRLDQTLFTPNIRYSSLNIQNKDEVNKLVESFYPDAILHAAAITQVDDCETNKSLSYSVNVDGTRHLIDAAAEVSSRLIYLSTDFVFSGSGGPYKETDPTAPVNYYGKTKELAEQFIMESGLHWAIIRTVLLYGNTPLTKRNNFIYWVKDSLTKGNPIRVVNDQIRTPTYIPDLVNGIHLVLDKGAQGIFHISGEEIMTPYDIAISTANFLGLPTDLITPVDASSFSQLGQRPLKTGFVIDKAKKDLNFLPTPFETSLAKLFQ
jgi:dTDP-4-dehydrorhamnose reductase